MGPDPTEYYDEHSWHWYDWMSRDFFEFLKDRPDQTYYEALGSKQHVKVQKKFQSKAKKAHKLCEQAIAADGNNLERQKWRQVFGNAFPAPEKIKKGTYDAAFKNTEQFIEDRFPVDVRYFLDLECNVSQEGFRKTTLLEMLNKFIPLRPLKELSFFVSSTNIPDNCQLYWKVLNRGAIAERRDQIRGQIVADGGHMQRTERTSFKGEHLVEIYAVWNGVVIARDDILVPIS